MKIGIFGGTFSPPHIGHIRAAEAFVHEVGLDRLFIIPTFVPHNKDMGGVAPSGARLRMCRLAFENEKCKVSDIEIKRGGKSYTADTIEEMKKIYPDDDFFILFGTDMFLILGKWVRAEEIFKSCTIVCVLRGNDSEAENLVKEKITEYEEQFDAKIRLIKLEPTEISSSTVREYCRADEDISRWVTPAIAEFIHKKGLYK